MTSPRWTALVLAAGHGTRMRSDTPKVAHPLCERPILRHVLAAARAAGVDDCVVVVGRGSDAADVRHVAGEGVRFAVQEEPLGTGHAVESAREALTDAEFVLIMNGDVPLVQKDSLEKLMAVVGRGETPLAILTAAVPVESYGFLTVAGDRITGITETKGNEGIGVNRREVRLINSGQYAVRADWLWSRLATVPPSPSGERYLTALAAIAHEEGTPGVAIVADDPDEVRGINDRAQLAEAEQSMRRRINTSHMLDGVTIVDPATTYIGADVTIGPDTVIEPGTHLRGATRIGRNCRLGPASDIRDSQIGDQCQVRRSVIEESSVEDGVEIGPFSHLRPGSYVCEGTHIGNYAELKNTRLGQGVRMGHFSYLGDAEVGDGANIGAGTITANFDGERKHRTVIGAGAFIGTDTMLVAPVTVGAGSRTAAGSVVTRDVPDRMMAIGAPARIRAITPTEEGRPES